MKITDLSIKYRTTVVVLTLVLVAGGLYSYVTIPKEASPSIEIPLIVTTTVYPGVSPDDIESLITQPIEREVQSINGIKEIRSTSTEGVSTVIVEFNPDVSMDEAYQRVRDKVGIAKPKLPNDVEEPIISEIDFSEFPIMTINLAANYSLSRLKEVGEDLAEEIETVSSVLGVDVLGGMEREVQVNIDLNALKGYNLTYNDVISTISQENTTIPGGSVDVNRLNYLIRVSGQFTDPSQIENLVVKMPEAIPGQARPSPIYVRDVADVVFGYKQRTSYARLTVLKVDDADGELKVVPTEDIREAQVVSLNVKMRSGENILETVEETRAILDAFPLPNGTQVQITGDQSKYVRDLISDLENNIISGLFFVVGVLLFFLGVRNATLVGIAIPLSMFISFLLLQALGYTLNFIILFSLIIALGMLVDNAIVIVENIYRYREEGYERFEAARLATSEVGGAVVASTATTVAAFAPMLFWPGIIGEFMSYMPLTLIITLISSLFVAIIINPVLTGFFVRIEDEQKQPRGLWAKRIGYGAVGLSALIIGLANPLSLGVLIGMGAILYLSHRYLLKPVADRFIRTGLPRLIERYKGFLKWVLERDYTVRRAFWRNTFSLSAFTVGFILFLFGSFLTPLLGQTAASVLSLPGMVLLGIGALGILVHTFESMLIGRSSSVRFGLGLGVVVALTMGLIFLGGRPLSASVIGALLILPVLIILFGLLGALLKVKGPLLLTDNRARLMNLALGSLFFIVGIFAVAPTGVEFFPETDPQQIQVKLNATLGTNIETSNQLAQEAKRRIDALLTEQADARANIKNLQVGVGTGGDIMFGGGAARPENSTVTLNVVDYADRPESSMATLNRLREQLQGIPGVEIEIDKDQQGPPTGSPVNIEISGEKFETIVAITNELRTLMQEGADTGAIPGLVDIKDNLNTGRPELKVNIDRERAARFGLNTAQVAGTIRSAINGTEASKYRDGEDEYDITVRLAESDRESLESLESLTILYEGRQIPLVAVADFEIGGGLGAITRLDMQRVVTITGSNAPGIPGPEVLAGTKAYLAAYEQTLPPGYTLTYTGESEDQQESFGFLTTALLIGISLIFMIMVAQFNRISGPFIIIVAVGLSLIGVLLGLVLTRTPFGLMTFIGIISLAGIVVNNSIVLVDYIMQLQARGLTKADAIIQGGATRLRPVLLTALTTILGLIPLTFGLNIDFVGLITALKPAIQFGSENTQFWGPMGIAIISGLTFATFLTLVIVPVMYSIFDSLGVRLGQVLKGAPAAPLPGGNGTAPAFEPTPVAG